MMSISSTQNKSFIDEKQETNEKSHEFRPITKEELENCKNVFFKEEK